MFLYFLVLFLTFIVVMPDTKSLLKNIFLLKDFTWFFYTNIQYSFFTIEV